MNITIIAVGKVKEKFYCEAVSEYVKRLGRYCNIVIHEVPDEQTPDKSSEALDLQIKKKEAQRIQKLIKQDAYVITLEIKGKKMDSLQFANKIEDLAIRGISNITFIIGGSLGLHPDISLLAHEKISFSDMTFPHQLMRVILTEQIYRGFRIINREPYHK